MESLHADFSLHWDHELRRANGPLSLTLSPSDGERGLPVARGKRFMERCVLFLGGMAGRTGGWCSASELAGHFPSNRVRNEGGGLMNRMMSDT